MLQRRGAAPDYTTSWMAKLTSLNYPRMIHALETASRVISHRASRLWGSQGTEEKEESGKTSLTSLHHPQQRFGFLEALSTSHSPTLC